MLNAEQFAATNKANIDALTSLTAKAFAGFEQLAALNLQAVKASLGEAQEAGESVLAAKDPQALIALQVGLLQPNADKATAYGKQVVGIVTSLKADIDKLAAEQAASAQSAFAALIEAAGKNAPEGMGDGVAMFKSAIASATTAFDSLQKAGKQAADAATANYEAVTGAVTKASKGKRG